MSTTDNEYGGFTAFFAGVVILSAVAAAATAPLVAYALDAVNLHFIFPRIFDRVVMVAAIILLALAAPRLRLGELLRDGFGDPRCGWTALIAGLTIALAIVTVLLGLVAWTTGRQVTLVAIAVRAMRHLPAALLIGVFEEGFFRAVLFGGMRRDFATRNALVASSAVYAAAHLVHAPRHYYLAGFEPAAGFENLAASLARIVHPDGLLPMVCGLFLLGLVLGEAFRLTGRVYLAVGLHSGFVLGAKCWPLVAGAPLNMIPCWLAGVGPVPLIAAPAAWLAAVGLLISLKVWFRRPPLTKSHPRSLSPTDPGPE